MQRVDAEGGRQHPISGCLGQIVLLRFLILYAASIIAQVLGNGFVTYSSAPNLSVGSSGLSLVTGGLTLAGGNLIVTGDSAIAAGSMSVIYPSGVMSLFAMPQYRLYRNHGVFLVC